MHADRTIDIGIPLGESFDVGGVVGADADAQKVSDPTLAGRSECGIQ
jgi:hypothetical protein